MAKIGLDIIHEDDDLVAINKPPGVLSIPDRLGKDISLKQMLIERFGKIYVVHRIDRDTSGLILFAKNEESHKALSQLFEGRDIEKYYTGLVYGNFTTSSGNINAPITEHPAKNGKMIIHRKGKDSETDYEVLENFKGFSWVKFRIHTGRTHQIRVHMQHIGHSIVCDELYGDPKPVFISALKNNYKLSKHDDQERPILSRLALHSWQLKFKLGEKEYNLEAELPKDLRATMQQMRKK
ncbi:MAG: pseudouridine synthase [Chitinophagaceae bacterium]|nr:pseudouridine synthase [Chitinophagaceae bacterium]